MSGQDVKIAVVMSSSLETWQKPNVTAFTVSGIASTKPELVGLPYADGSGHEYLPMLRWPVVILTGDDEATVRAFVRTVQRRLPTTVHTRGLFTTSTDIADRAAVASVPFDDLDVVGFAVAGPRKDIDKALDGLRLHP
jgi:hypothetical protein